MRKKIGEFLVDLGVLTEKEVGKILRSARESGLRFGETAISLGILKNDTPIRAFGTSASIDFFHLHPQFFPQSTKQLLSLDTIVSCGALPLGFKKKYKLWRRKKLLNVGFLDPTRRDAIQTVEEEARKSLGNDLLGMKSYLVLADEFLDVLESVYCLTPEEIKRRTRTSIDETLYSFLDAKALSETDNPT